MTCEIYKLDLQSVPSCKNFRNKSLPMFSPLSIFLCNLRLRVGLSQRQLADLIGYEQGYVSALEL